MSKILGTVAEVKTYNLRWIDTCINVLGDKVPLDKWLLALEYEKQIGIQFEDKDKIYANAKYPIHFIGSLPEDAQARKDVPIYTGFLKYFPKAIVAVTELSLQGNKQHHPDKPLHWDKSKSTDELDALTRHLLDSGTYDSDGVLHDVKVAWRAMANLERKLDAGLKFKQELPTAYNTALKEATHGTGKPKVRFTYTPDNKSWPSLDTFYDTKDFINNSDKGD